MRSASNCLVVQGPTRVEFLGFSLAEKALFYVLVSISIGVMVYQIAQRAKIWRQGKPIGWKLTPIANIWSYVVGQRKVRSSRRKSGAPMHLMIFYGFLALTLATTLLAINTYSPIKFHYGTYYVVYEFLADLLGLCFVVGIVWALVRRLKFRPAGAENAPSDVWTLVLLLGLGVTGYLLEAARMAHLMQDPSSNPANGYDASGFVGYAIAQLLGPVSLGAYKAIWWFHMAWVFVFFAVIPRMRLRHIVMAIFSSAGKPDRPMGYLAAISMEEVEQTGIIGVAEAKDYSRWHLMSLDACMGCGRCTEVCPANGAGKILNPRQVVQDVRGAMVSEKPIAEAISEEALWACTTCNACVEACPVLIRHVDLIVDSRRNLVAEGKLSGSAANMLRMTAKTSNAWGADSQSREDWMRELDIPMARDGVEFDVLLWVGCAGATDPGAMKTTKAVAALLKQAGVKFACLGKEESCTGDSARRVGDEFLFQEMAQKNVATFQKYGVKQVVTPCPHCMNTLQHEYREFGVELSVRHHTEALSDLVASGKLKSADPGQGQTTYHDPCYLARANNIADAPRSLLGVHSDMDRPSGITGPALEGHSLPNHLAEPPHRGRKTLCCGAGGGRMWMEEQPDQRPGVRRAKELLATGAKTVAVGCPFCRIMLDASVKQITDDDIKLVDLAEMLQEANAK